MGFTYNQWLAAGLYAVYSVAIMLMMIQCAQASRDRGVNPVFIYGFFAGIVYGLHDVGFIGGTFAENAALMGIAPLTLVAMVALYLLGVMYFISYGSFKRVLRSGQGAMANDASDVELIARKRTEEETGKPIENDQVDRHDEFIDAEADDLALSNGTELHDAVVEALETGTEVGTAVGTEAKAHSVTAFGEPPTLTPAPSVQPLHDDGMLYQDRLSKQAALVRRAYRLSARETEVMELIARGNTVARIAEQLIVSENTIRTHSKRIYAKLNIHKRQELLDLIESYSPKDLGE